MFRFLFPKQYRQLKSLEGTVTEHLERVEELYRHLKIHRAYVNETPARHELREGVQSLTLSNFYSPNFTIWPTNMGAVATATPAKKRRKRKKGAK